MGCTRGGALIGLMIPLSIGRLPGTVSPFCLDSFVWVIIIFWILKCWDIHVYTLQYKIGLLYLYSLYYYFIWGLLKEDHICNLCNFIHYL